MEDNVFITVRERGKLRTRRQGHNVWTAGGRQVLSQLLGLATIDPDAPELEHQIKYVSFGIGSATQTNSAVADSAPFSTSYEVGADPQSSNGHEYNKETPTLPLINSLERPVRITGGSNSYATAPLTDVWRKQVELTTHPTPYSTTFRCTVFPPSGEIVYAPFTPVVPLSEAGLYWDSATLDRAYDTVAAYFNFDTINLNDETILEIAWTVRF